MGSILRAIACPSAPPMPAAAVTTLLHHRLDLPYQVKGDNKLFRNG